LIVDPPATGPSPETRRAPLEFAPATLIYVSCNPPTPARDLADLQQRFAIGSVTPLDMFPETAEIEVAVHLRTPSALTS
jgi:23S rRNA (uracil1939-C5)-methyltransferase